MSIEQIKKSGILELYVLNDLSDIESQLVQYLRVIDERIKQEILEIETALEVYAILNQVDLEPKLESRIMKKIDNLERTTEDQGSEEDRI